MTIVLQLFGLDYIQLEFIRLGKKNLTYDVYVGFDHNLANVINEKPVGHNDYFQKVLDWIDKKMSARYFLPY
ncbi:hypothetical protein ACVWYG_003666 [Pedobacter sp. UYEF25]